MIYFVRGRDRIAPDALVIANLRVGTPGTSRVLNRSLVAPGGRAPMQRISDSCFS